MLVGCVCLFGGLFGGRQQQGGSRDDGCGLWDALLLLPWCFELGGRAMGISGVCITVCF